MTQHLFLISLGPVQDFISSARRSRDLWFGSWLLSELSKTAAYSIHAEGGTLIFPAPTNPATDLAPNSHLDVGNKILALLPVAEVAVVGAQIEQAIRARLMDITTTTFAPLTTHSDFDHTTAEQQILDLIEYYWVALPYDEQTYPAVRTRVEAAMAARKATRNFQPVSWGKDRPKSSLDGQREAVIAESAYPSRAEPPRKQEQKIHTLYTMYGASQAERLSGVDLLKRNGNVERFIHHGKPVSEARFMSTSHVAAQPLLTRLAAYEGTARDAWSRYLRELRTSAVQPALIDREKIAWKYSSHPVIGDYDGSLLFEERLDDTLAGTPPDDIQAAKGALRDFLSVTLGRGVAPLPYYALLHADGDNMGRVIDATGSVQGHQDLSQKLSDFAGSVQHLVEETYDGALIYAGGDDVLALLPLHTVLTCASELHDNFRNKLEQYTAPAKDDCGSIHPTLSVGIAVCHHIEPLSDALALVRRAEKCAKAVPCKNALAVIVSKRSGVDRVVAGSWEPRVTQDSHETPDVLGSTLDRRLIEFAALHRKDAFPDGAAYELHDLSVRVGHTLPPDALQREAVRILQRKRAQRGDQRIHEATLQAITRMIERADVTLEQLANEIIVARLFADAYELAFPNQQTHGPSDSKE